MREENKMLAFCKMCIILMAGAIILFTMDFIRRLEKVNQAMLHRNLLLALILYFIAAIVILFI